MKNLETPDISTQELLTKRRDNNSTPENRSDNRDITLLIEGGGMRGVVSAGMISALEELKLLNSFDNIIGCSAGSITGAYFVAGQAKEGTRIFFEDLDGEKFISLTNLTKGIPPLDINYLVDEVWINRKKLDLTSYEGKPKLLIPATDIETGEPYVFENPLGDQLSQAFKSSAKVPIYSGLKPVSINSVKTEIKLLDSSLSSHLGTFIQKTTGSTDLVVLRSRPEGELQNPWYLKLQNFIASQLLSNIHTPVLGDRIKNWSHYYQQEISMINHLDERRRLMLQLNPSVKEISSSETSADVLRQGARDGFEEVIRVFSQENPTPW